MVKLPSALLFLFFLVISFGPINGYAQDPSAELAQSDSISVLVVRGGHPYDTPGFEEMCGELADVKCDLVLTAHFETMSAEDIQKKYDALLFLNQNKKYTTTKRNRKRYMDLAELGVGMVFLHFTLSSEPEWDEYHDLIGGKWFLKKFEKNKDLHSTYFVDMTVDVSILDKDHPATAELEPFTMTDTFYGNIRMDADVHPLLGSNRDEVADAIAWAHQYKKSKVVYLMPGFSKKAYQNESYRKFLSNSLRYVAVAPERK
jgi:type 1 glutamine amidotransferase